MEKAWETKAALYELLAKTFVYTEREIIEALVAGDYSEALVELIEANGLQVDFEDAADCSLSCYCGNEADKTFHCLRKEYTRLYVGAQGPLIIPYAGTWKSAQCGQIPLLFVGKDSMAIERFMRASGIVQAPDTNNPLDHIGSMLEFLMYLSIRQVGISENTDEVEMLTRAYENFYTMHFIEFAHAFAEETLKESNENFFKIGAAVLQALPGNSL